MPRAVSPLAVRRAAGVLGGVVIISLLHYSVSVHIVILHEVFRRLYYVPIVAAAVLYGVRAAIGTSLVASLLYLPHVVVAWQAWPIVEVSQYGELILFNVIAVVTGVLADRLRAERNRYQEAAGALREAYAAAQARAEERLQVDRFVTIGRLASGVADQVRNPLAALAGCLEILEASLPRGHPKAEFVELAKKEIARLDGLIRDFLEFARPTRPAPRPVDLQQVLRATARLAQSVLTAQEVALKFAPCDRALVVEADDEQLKRALLSVVLEMAALSRGDHIALMVRAENGAAVVRVGAEVDVIRTPELFEPFSSATAERGLALAIARRLIENQRGSVQVEPRERMLYCVVRLPLAPSEPETHPQVPLRATDTHRSGG